MSLSPAIALSGQPDRQREVLMSEVTVPTVYFDQPGPANTARTLDIGRTRAEQLGLRTILVATTDVRSAHPVVNEENTASVPATGPENVLRFLTGERIGTRMGYRAPIDVTPPKVRSPSRPRLYPLEKRPWVLSTRRLVGPSE